MYQLTPFPFHLLPHALHLHLHPLPHTPSNGSHSPKRLHAREIPTSTRGHKRHKGASTLDSEVTAPASTTTVPKRTVPSAHSPPYDQLESRHQRSRAVLPPNILLVLTTRRRFPNGTNNPSSHFQFHSLLWNCKILGQELPRFSVSKPLGNNLAYLSLYAIKLADWFERVTPLCQSLVGNYSLVNYLFIVEKVRFCSL
ncbi:hypothetical protein VNO78_02897 [Psophocarpus tetragonolobus]|uniref:Uncharacterized protein n=1 Tax=Psophocarpus tetragonolobus TaxID=3891 RepID=A0AAN9XWF8_PSOTE